MVQKISEKSLATAEIWAKQSVKHRTAGELDFAHFVSSVIKNKNDMLFLQELLSTAFRTTNKARSLAQVKYIYNKYNKDSFFPFKYRMKLWFFAVLSAPMPGFVLGSVERNLRAVLKNLLVEGAEASLTRHIIQREKEGFRSNIKLITLPASGEKDAELSVREYKKLLEGEAKSISVRAAAIYSQINPLDYEKSLSKLKIRLIHILRAANERSYLGRDKGRYNKFVNIDMEKCDDIELIYQVFTELLDEDEFLNFYAGISLPTYLPNISDWVKKLTVWSHERIARGGAPVRVRIMKGGFLRTEFAEAADKNWPLVIYNKKVDTDANFKCLLLEMLKPENAAAVHLGVATHNIFDIAFAYELAKEYGTLQYVQFEGYDGIATSVFRTLTAEGLKSVLYTYCTVTKTLSDALFFIAARLSEIKVGEDFMLAYMLPEVGSNEWRRLRDSFIKSIDAMPHINNIAFSRTDRNVEPEFKRTDFSKFTKDAVSDFTLPQNRHWAKQIALKWRNVAGGREIASCIGGNEYKDSDKIVSVYDRSALPIEKLVGQYHLADEELLTEACNVAVTGFGEWANVSFEDKLAIFDKAGYLLQKYRGDLIGLAAAEQGKVFTETDAEVSDAINSAYFYSYAMKNFMDKYPQLAFTGKGVSAVVSSWNSPVALPAAGLFVSLVSGNAAIFVPAAHAVFSGRMLCDLLWEAGVPRNVLQFVSADIKMVEDVLSTDGRIDRCMFAGGAREAWRILEKRPNLPIFTQVETNSLSVVTAMADRTKAVQNIIASAFLDSGHKASPASVLLLETELFNDKGFQDALKDAAMSIKVGSVWDLGSKLGCLPDEPINIAKRSLAMDNSQWLLPPAYANDNPFMLRPAIKWGVDRATYPYTAELSGPVLSVIRVKDLDDAIAVVKHMGQEDGARLESLDEREIAHWQTHVKNTKHSTQNDYYLARLSVIKEKDVADLGGALDPLAEKLAAFAGEDAELFKKISANYEYNARSFFDKDETMQQLRVADVVIRYYKENSLKHLAQAILAVRALGISYVVSVDDGANNSESGSVSTRLVGIGVHAITEREQTFYGRFQRGLFIRYLDKVSIRPDAYTRMLENRVNYGSHPVISEGRFELLNYHRMGLL